MVPFERPYQLSYLTSIDTFGLSPSVSELFRWPTFGDLWPFVSGSTVTPGSTPMVPFERPYSSSYSPPIDIFGLSRSISEFSADILSVTFDLSFGVNHDPEVNPNGTIRKAIPTFLCDFVDTFCVSCTVFEIIGIFVCMENPYSRPNFGGFTGFRTP